jgi:hypothetical protein
MVSQRARDLTIKQVAASEDFGPFPISLQIVGPTLHAILVFLRPQFGHKQSNRRNSKYDSKMGFSLHTGDAVIVIVIDDEPR